MIEPTEGSINVNGFDGKTQGEKVRSELAFLTNLSLTHDVSMEANYKMGGLLELYKNNVLAKILGGESYLQVYNVNMAEIEIPKESKGIDRGTIAMMLLTPDLEHHS